MPIASDFKPGLPVIIEGQQPDIVQAGQDLIVAESRLPVRGDSRHVQWTIPVAEVLQHVAYDVHRDFVERGSVLCDDCGTRVRPKTLESLPEHGCTERQKTRADSSTEEG